MTEPSYEQSEALEGKPIKLVKMTDSRDKPELETLDYKPPGTIEQPISAPPAFMGFNSAVIKPETRVNKAENASQHLEEPKCRLCNDKKEIVRTFTGSIGLETAWRPKGSSTSREDEIKACPDCTCTEQPNQDLMIIEEIEGLFSQVNDKLYKLSGGQPVLMKCTVTITSKAIEEIDLFQKTTLFELRKAFE